MPAVKTKARFVEPMLLQRTEKLSEGGFWSYELKLDGEKRCYNPSLPCWRASDAHCAF